MTHVRRMDANAAGVRLNQPPDKGAEVGVTVLFRSFRLKISGFFFLFPLNALRGTQVGTVGAPRQGVPGPQPHKPSNKHPRTRTSYCATHTDKQNTSFSSETALTRSLMTGWLCTTLAEILKSSAGFNEPPRQEPHIRGKSAVALASRHWSDLCELFKEARREARPSVPPVFQISSMLNIGNEPGTSRERAGNS